MAGRATWQPGLADKIGKMMKFNACWKIGILLITIIAVSLGASGVGYAAPSLASSPEISLCSFSWVESNDNGSTSAAGGYNPVDPGDDGSDPYQPQEPGAGTDRYGMDVAGTHAELNSSRSTITVTLDNAYPGYYPTVFFGLRNDKGTPGIVKSINIDHSPDISVTLSGIEIDQVIPSGTEAAGALAIGMTGSDGKDIEEAALYTLTASITVVQIVEPTPPSPPALTITTTSPLPDGTVGVNYNQKFEATGGPHPYRWSVISGELPDGLELIESSGVFHGHPQAAGDYSFRIQVKDKDGNTAFKDFTLKILAAYTLNLQVEGRGSVGLSKTSSYYAEGDKVTLTAYPAAGSQFKEWKNDVSGNASTVLITMDSNKTVTAVFVASGQGPENTSTLGPQAPKLPENPDSNQQVQSGNLNISGQEIGDEGGSPTSPPVNTILNSPFNWWWLSAIVLAIAALWAGLHFSNQIRKKIR
jgi:hypothetical protein